MLAFAVGSAIGVVTGLVLAPAPGAETRRRLRELGAKSRAQSLKVMEAGSRMAADQAHRLGRALEEGRDAYARESESSRIKTTLREGIESGADATG
jgi:gas vesicle protein